jgi:hypothetical protein
MTTIAFDGSTLAADTMANWSNLVQVTHKVAR